MTIIKRKSNLIQRFYFNYKPEKKKSVAVHKIVVLSKNFDGN